VTVRAIRLFPDDVLRQRCRPVDRFDDELARLVADMVETMYAAPGIGLAAPQVGDTRRVFVVDLSVGEDPAQLRVFVNPRIVEEEGQVADFEGCLSIPELSEKVERPERVVVEAQDARGESFRVEAADWLARAICHENDHLDGVLFVDRLRGLRREKARRALRKMAREREEVMA
jgi:peptide deformylase